MNALQRDLEPDEYEALLWRQALIRALEDTEDWFFASWYLILLHKLRD